MICHSRRFIFVHINKTGGTSVERVFVGDAHLANVPHKHRSASFYCQRYPAEFREYYKFSFVRNPWDWLVSRYFWSRYSQRLFDYSFEEMMDRLSSNTPLLHDAPWLEWYLAPQVKRLLVDGVNAMDFVGRFESLQEDFNCVSRAIGQPETVLPHVFKTQREAYTKYYNDTTKAIVESLYHEDISAFDYRYGD